MKIQIEQFSAQGDKDENQDYKMHIINEDYALFVVADGLGGGDAGDKASRYFCMGLVHLASMYTGMMARDPEQTFANWIEAAVDRMGVLFAGDRNVNNAYTTCAILYIQGDLVITAHSGDTRIYRIGVDRTVWRTKDHSVVQMLVDQQVVDEHDMGRHSLQHKLTRCISVAKELNPEITVLAPTSPGDTFVLCTDGVWGYTRLSEISALADPECSKKNLIKLMKTAYLRAEGFSDNLTLQWIRIIA
jgi:protein phosphatase